MLFYNTYLNLFFNNCKKMVFSLSNFLVLSNLRVIESGNRSLKFMGPLLAVLTINTLIYNILKHYSLWSISGDCATGISMLANTQSKEHAAKA